MAEGRIPSINRPDIVVTPFRTLLINRHRERRVSLTESPSGKAVRVDTYDETGRHIGGSLCVYPQHLPALLTALAEAAAAIGVEIPAASAPQPAGVALARNLARARAH